jgi:nitroreductase
MRINERALDLVTERTTAEAALHRRSIRTYRSDAIPLEDLKELVQLAARAPSAYNAQPWRFVIVQDSNLKNQLAAAAYGQLQVASAPAVIVLYSDMEDALARMPESVHPDLPADKRDAGVVSFRAGFEGQSVEQRETWGAMQSNIALGYLLLLAESRGYGTSPMLGFDAERVKTVLGLPAHVRIPALIAIGYPEGDGFRPHRLPAESLIEVR